MDAGAAAAVGEGGPAEWRQFGGGAARAGRMAVAGPTTSSIRRVIKLGNGSQSMAVVGANGQIYVPTMNHLGEVKAFGPDGQELWRYQFASRLQSTTERVVSPPALSADGLTLYVADALNTVVALEAATGRPLWNVSTCIVGKIPEPCGELMGPLLLDDLGEALYFAGRDGWLYKVNLRAEHPALVWYTFVGSADQSGPSLLPGSGLGHVFLPTQPNSGGAGTFHCLASGVGAPPPIPP